MSQCNKCVLAHIKAQAKKNGERVVVRPSTEGMGGVNVYRHKRDEPLNRETDFVAWLMEFNETCDC